MTMLDYANLASGPGRRERRVWWKSALFTLMWTALAGVILFGGFGIGSVVGVVGVVVIYKLVQSLRRQRAMAVLGHVEQAVRLNLPLPRMLYAAELSEEGALRRRLRHVQELVSAGAPVGMALEEAVPELSKRAVTLAMAGERSGRLGVALTQVLREMRSRREQDVAAEAFYLVYPFVLMVMVMVVSWMLWVFVGAKFEELLRDFGARVSGPLELLNVLGLLAPVLGVLVVGVGSVVVGMMLWQVFHPGRWDDSHVRDLWDILLWLIPGGRGYVRDKGLADACAVAGDAMEAGRPLHEALMEVSMVQLSPPVRGRVKAWRQGVESGLPADEAAKRARLPELFVGMVRTGLATGDLPATMRFLARYYRGRFSRTAELLRGALIPALVLAMGVVVLGVALSLFVPLMDIAEAAMPFGEVWP